MTIKELEEAVGMTRANIRFYEQEGLISPLRGENGYRDYSQADAETLEKIKLLRQLQLGLDTIRALQKGETSLSTALAEQLQKLETHQEALDQAMEVCRRLQEQGTPYEALDAQPWLQELEPAAPRGAPPGDEAPPYSGHPIRRYLARHLDLSFYSLFFALLLLFRFHQGHPLSLEVLQSPVFHLVFSYLGVVPMLLLEPLFLHFWGTTPGKWILGIRLRQANGEKLTMAQSLRRTWGVFSRGMGFNIPFHSYWQTFRCYQQSLEGERMPWTWPHDAPPERMEVSTNVESSATYVAVQILVIFLMFAMTLQALLPPNRGRLDMAEFCENYNYYCTLLNDSYGWINSRSLDEQGLFQGDVLTRDETHCGIRESCWAPLLEQGELVGFRYTAVMEGEDAAPFHNSPQTMGLLAFGGSLPQMSFLNFSFDQWLSQLPTDRWNYDCTYRGVRFIQEVHGEGMVWGQLPGENYTQNRDGLTLYLTFTLRLA